MANIHLVSLFLLVVLASSALAKINKKHEDLKFGEGEASPDDHKSACKHLVCGAGRDCSLLPDGTPTCVCVETCPDRVNRVCGSDGATYLNHCHLHRTACATATHISIEADGACPGDEGDEEEVSTSNGSNHHKTKPAVCLVDDRDVMRRLMIDWYKSSTRLDASSRANRFHKMYNHLLRREFSACDVDRNAALDSNELLLCVERNKTVANSVTTSQIIRGLCVDALIDMSDSNKDWQLSLDEFKHLLDPHFTPEAKLCKLGDHTYKDGAETDVDCNTCVCACGHWVCTAASCSNPVAPIKDKRKRSRLYKKKKHGHHRRGKNKVSKDKEYNERDWQRLVEKFKALASHSNNKEKMGFDKYETSHKSGKSFANHPHHKNRSLKKHLRRNKHLNN